MRTAYLDMLYELAQKDKRVYALISDNGAIVYDKYRRDLPEQYLNLGISEADIVGMAAYEHEGLVYLRLGTNKESEIYEKDYEFGIGKSVTIKNGDIQGGYSFIFFE